jgi:AcrR family transcriptional regulator
MVYCIAEYKTFGACIPDMARPREFDCQRALDAALRVFWEKGYEGATLDDLTSAMGINRPSLYGAFGNKEQLFRKVLERYAEGPAAYVVAALEAPTARECAEAILRGAAELGTCPRNPGGCLAVHAALATGGDAETIRKTLIEFRAAGEGAIRERFERAQSEGDLPAEANPADLARFIATVVRGMAVQASSGASREELEAVIVLALRAWP